MSFRSRDSGDFRYAAMRLSFSGSPVVLNKTSRPVMTETEVNDRGRGIALAGSKQADIMAMSTETSIWDLLHQLTAEG